MAAFKRSLCLQSLLVAALFGSLVSGAKSSPAFGDRELVSLFPSNPGFPEGVAVHQDKVYVCGAATSAGTAGRSASTITITDLKSGTVETVFVTGEDTSLEHQLSCCIVSKTQGHDEDSSNGGSHSSLYAVSPQLGILRFDLVTFQQSVYAPAPPGGWIVANDLAFDPSGRLFMTESNPTPIAGGGKLWVIPPGGGAPTVWLEGPPLSGGFPNGLAVSPNASKLYLTVSTTVPPPNLGNGVVYSLPLTDLPPDASALQVVHAYTNGEIPDGIRVGASGKLYVVLALVPRAGPASPDFLGGIDILSSDGFPLTRLLTSNGQGPNYFNPANIAFDNKRKAAIVTNHGFLCDASSAASIDACSFSAIRVFLEEKGAKEF